jgi:hypothetical protein
VRRPPRNVSVSLESKQVIHFFSYCAFGRFINASDSLSDNKRRCGVRRVPPRRPQGNAPSRLLGEKIYPTDRETERARIYPSGAGYLVLKAGCPRQVVLCVFVGAPPRTPFYSVAPTQKSVWKAVCSAKTRAHRN